MLEYGGGTVGRWVDGGCFVEVCVVCKEVDGDVGECYVVSYDGRVGHHRVWSIGINRWNLCCCITLGVVIWKSGQWSVGWLSEDGSNIVAGEW